MAIVVGTPAENSTASGTSLTLPVPGSDGDLVLAFVGHGYERAFSSFTADWTELFSLQSTDGSVIDYVVYGKDRGASETDATVTVSGATQLSLILVPISGAALANVDTAGAQSTAEGNPYVTTITSQSVTTTADNSLVVRFINHRYALTAGWVGASTRIAVQEVSNLRSHVAADIQATAGASGTDTIGAQASARHSKLAFFITPAAASAPTITSATITGTSQVGQTLTANVVTDQDPVDSIAYQWQKAATDDAEPGTDISGETSSTLALTYADFGDLLDTAAYVRVQAVATKNSLDSDEESSAWQAVTAPTGGGGASNLTRSPFIVG